jgi:hypothetical protein
LGWTWQGGDESDEEVSGDDSDDEPIGNKAAKPSMPLKKRMAMSDDEDEEDDFEATIRAELGYAIHAAEPLGLSYSMQSCES